MGDPIPGTPEAIEQGCSCPVIDNHYGKGFRGQTGVFVYSSSCPMHGLAQCPAPARQDETE